MITKGVPINFCPACGEQLEYDVIEMEEGFFHEMFLCWNSVCPSEHGDIVVKKVNT
tara:strand:+ start:42 stop:209 length:168 start_codon:yes stop_codon:yes gene_type:complete